MTPMDEPTDGSSSLSVFTQPIVRAQCRGVPIRDYGYTWILGGSPDLVDDVQVQVGNDAPLRKVPLKASQQITRNRIGGNATGMPHSPATDYLPLEAIHLIGGDPQTCWCSRTQPQPNAEPVWIRLDLPMERTISRIVLRKRPPGPPRNQPGSRRPDPGAVEVGMAMPGELQIALSCDAQRWETVFSGPSGDKPDRGEFVCHIGGRRAKQILITGRRLPRVESWLFSFSIAEVEVYDDRGQNVALATRGTGVTVSSTQRSGQTVEAHRWLWPLQSDLGLKWVRVGYHDDPINWHWVERERGVLTVDPEADAAITWLAEHDIETVMALGFGNRLYTQEDPTRHLPQLWEWYYEDPAPPTTPEALEAWGRFVRFMAAHFRDRVRYFEIWNEWNVPFYWGAEVNVEDYLAVARTAIPILRDMAPEAKVMLGSFAGFAHGISAWSANELALQERESPILRAVSQLAPEVDVIGWHPFYQTSPEDPHMDTYAEDVRAFQSYCQGKGFRGEFMASEWTYGASYPPPAPPNWWGEFVCSEMEKAKYIARLSVLHAALGVTSIFCDQWNAYYPLDLGLMRQTFAADPISPQQPQAAYYVMRNLATALEALEPLDFAYEVPGGQPGLQTFALAREGTRALALWQSGLARDVCPGVPHDVLIEGHPRAATGYDPLNGTERALQLQPEGQFTRVAGILVRDYPVLLFFTD